MPPPSERSGIKVQSERAILAAVRLPDSIFDHRDPFGELRALAEQAGAVVVGELTQNLDRPVAGTYMGSGKVEELKRLCEALEAQTVIFDHELSPKQIAGIEKVTERKVLDRSELILDIFASRATTHEAKLQVELAQLEYTYPRLRAMWSHLERIVGAGGIAGVGTRGPGEQQLEIDRRLAQNRKDDLKRRLADIQARKRREVYQRRLEHFTVGLVGYTNAGKSTLFNTLTTGGAYADDRLFATLMTRTRDWSLGDGLSVMLSDTVGFVRDLPHNLVASFKATLEEATHADVLLIVLDVSDPACEMHYQTVNSTLDDLFREIRESGHSEDADWREPSRIVLLNKADRLKDNAELLVWLQKAPNSIPLCALPGAENAPPPLGQAELIERVRMLARGPIIEVVAEIPLSDSRLINLLETRGEVLERHYEPNVARLRLRIGLRQLELVVGSGGGRNLLLQPVNGAELPASLRPRQSRSPIAWDAASADGGEGPGAGRGVAGKPAASRAI